MKPVILLIQLIIAVYSNYLPHKASKLSYPDFTINTDSIALTIVIKSYERYTDKPYYLFNGYYIGYGHRNYEHFSAIDKQIADSLFYSDFSHFYSLFPEVHNSKLRLLLAALSFNIGPYKVKKSRLYTFAINNNTQAFKNYYLNFSYICGRFHKGLYQRRKNEIRAVNL